MNNYTVVLMRPAYMTAEYGPDTYLAHVTSPSQDHAVVDAQTQAAEADGVECGVDPTDYYPVFTCLGHQIDLTSGR